jgi:UDP-glucose 4-epimerase
MLVLVTGAAGRIGAHLTHALIREGHRVRALVIPGDPRVALIAGPKVDLIEGRLENQDTLRTAVRGVDAIYHLAGALTSRGNTDEEFFEFNLRGTFNLLVAARDEAPRLRRFAYASSDAVYMAGPNHPPLWQPIDETQPRQPGSVYGASKAGAEDLCLTFWRRDGIPATNLRFGATCDAEELVDPQSVFSRWLFLHSALAFNRSLPDPSPAIQQTMETLAALDNGTEQLIAVTDAAGLPEIRQWGDARDVAEGCLLTLENPLADGQTFNLGGPAPFTSDELARHLSHRTGHPWLSVPLPIARAPWTLSSAKARGILGYTPSRTVFDMVDEAVSQVKA